MPHEITIPTDGARLDGYTVWDGYDGRTHYPGCYRDPAHHACALAEIARLKAQVAEYAKERLWGKMSDISESCWCIGWMSGNEYWLWRACELDTPQPYGMGVVEAQDIAELRLLREQANGWWIWPFDEHDPTFVTLEFAQQMVDRRKAQHVNIPNPLENQENLC